MGTGDGGAGYGTYAAVSTDGILIIPQGLRYPSSGDFITTVSQAVAISNPATLLVGTGTVSVVPYAFQVAVDVDVAGLAQDSRYFMYNQTLTTASTTTRIFEGICSFQSLSGAGAFNGEVNGFHSNQTLAAGSTALTLEGYETKFENYGTMTGYHIGLLSLPVNYSTGTASYLMGAKVALYNDNTTPGSIGNFYAYFMDAKGGAGTDPTNYRFLVGKEPNAPSVILGNLTVGSLTPGGGAGTMYVIGNDNSSGTFAFFVKTNSGARNSFYVDNSGTVHAAADTFQISTVGSVTLLNVKVGSNQVVGARNTGWSAMTGTADKATVYDTATVTLAQLAGRMLSIQAALTTHGLIGT